MICSNSKVRTGILFALLVLSNAGIGFGQQVTGTILGRVTDSTGAVLPGATVQIQNVETGFSRSEQADSAGRYLSRNLPLGQYSVTVQQQGFQTQVRRGIVLTVASEVVVNMEMAVGSVQERVEVTAEAPAIETTNATVSGLVRSDQIRDLPLNGRNIDQLALLSPGTFQNRAAANTAIQGMGLRLSVNGARPDANLFLMDGSVVNDHSNNGPNSATGATLGVEGILEFRVLTHNFSAEYGRNSGAVVSMVTRSGTNEFHGSLYEFVRNNIFDARNFFNPGKLPPYRRNQFGGAVGGPVLKDRMFFFANYEALRRRQGLTVIAGVPDANARRGLLPLLTNGSCPAQTVAVSGGLCQATLNPLSVPYLELYPLPNGRINGDGTGELISNVSTAGNENYYMERMDFRLSDKDSFYWRYVFNPSEFVTPRDIPIFTREVTNTSHFVVLNETHIFSGSSLNEFRFGFNRTTPKDTDGVPDVPPALDFIPGQGFGLISYGGGASGVAGGQAQLTEIGSSKGNNFFTMNLFQTTDTFSTVRGAHSLKFGGDLQRNQLNNRWGEPRGSMVFGGLIDLMAGRPSSFGGTLSGPNSSTIRGWRRTLFGWFVQDDIRLSHTLTLNVGLRHEIFSDPTEVHGRSGNLINLTDPKMTDGPPFHSNKLNFSPRFGLAWDPTGSGKTSLRVGAGMFYNHLDGRNWWRAASLNPTYQISISVNNPPFPHPLDQGFSAITQAVGSITPEIETPTVLHYNLDVHRQVTSSISVRAAYVGSYGYNQLRDNEQNLRAATIQPDGSKFYALSSPRLNPNFSQVERVLADAMYNYNALQLAVDKNVSRGLRLQAAYTYSKAMSNADMVTAGQSASTAYGAQDTFNLDADYSLSAYDQRQTMVLNGRYEMPWDRLLSNGVAKAILGGWSASGLYSYGSGLPLGVTLAFNNSQNGDTKNVSDRPNLKPGASNNPISGVTAGCGPIRAGQKLGTADRWYDPCAFELSPAGTYGNLGRNVVITPGVNKFDFTIVKATTLWEQKKLEFRAEFFNLFNHAQLTIPNRILFTSARAYSGNSGRITATATSNREIQLGMKLTF